MALATSAATPRSSKALRLRPHGWFSLPTRSRSGCQAVADSASQLLRPSCPWTRQSPLPHPRAESIRGFGDLVPSSHAWRVSPRRSHRPAGPLGKTRVGHVCPRTRCTMMGLRGLRPLAEARFFPDLPGFTVGVRCPKGTLVPIATLGMRH